MDTSQFELIEDTEEREGFITYLLANKAPITAVFSDNLQRVLVPDTLQSNQLFVKCNESLPEHDKAVFINFLSLKCQIFMRTEFMEVPGKKFCLDINSKMYRLQRRSNFRVFIPSESQIAANFDLIGDLAVIRKASLIDLSLGGCLVEFKPGLEQKQGTLVRGHISGPKIENINFEAIIRHTRVHSDSKSTRVGLEFSKLSGGGLRELNKLVMDIYRRLFARSM